MVKRVVGKEVMEERPTPRTRSSAVWGSTMWMETASNSGWGAGGVWAAAWKQDSAAARMRGRVFFIAGGWIMLGRGRPSSTMMAKPRRRKRLYGIRDVGAGRNPLMRILTHSPQWPVQVSEEVHLSWDGNHPKIGLTVRRWRSSLCATSANYWQPTPIRSQAHRRYPVLRGVPAEASLYIQIPQLPMEHPTPHVLTEVRRPLDKKIP